MRASTSESQTGPDYEGRSILGRWHVRVWEYPAARVHAHVPAIFTSGLFANAHVHSCGVYIAALNWSFGVEDDHLAWHPSKVATQGTEHPTSMRVTTLRHRTAKYCVEKLGGVVPPHPFGTYKPHPCLPAAPPNSLCKSPSHEAVRRVISRIGPEISTAASDRSTCPKITPG